MSPKHKRHGHGGHGPADHGGHDGHDVFDPTVPKPPGEVALPPPPTPGEDVDLRAIVRFGLVLLVVTIAAAAVIFVLMRQLGRRGEVRDPQTPAPPGLPRSLVSEYGEDVTQPDGDVRLQRQPFADLAAQRTREDELLKNYGWVDRPSETVRIPIDLAKRLVVQRGLPARGQEPVESLSSAASPTPSPRPAAVAPRPPRRPSPRPAAEPTATPEGGA